MNFKQQFLLMKTQNCVYIIYIYVMVDINRCNACLVIKSNNNKKKHRAKD